ncbi:MAG: succinyl-diaminopimelate desuccinylase [Zetaproteobacteria bacterium]|nr:MAG: succinyl-diaminopimelate desuccinylase [Zetaproteobacteria bacterium]
MDWNAQALSWAQALIRRPSITPEDAGCQDLIEEWLAPLGFTRERIDAGGVTNSIFVRPGEREGWLAFAGHTDVVPPGPESHWPYPPFAGVVEGGCLHGRGAQDMKTSIACFIAAVGSAAKRGALPGLMLAITSDEEGESIDGTRRIVERLQAQGRLPDACLVGEPSSKTQAGDVIRRGRRGVVQVHVQVRGKQGHSAYPEEADNAAHRLIEVLARVRRIDWGRPAPGFPPTSCEITNINAGTGAVNVIPGEATATIDIRYNPALSFAEIEARLKAALDDPQVHADIQHHAQAFATDADDPFVRLVARAAEETTGRAPRLDTGGGTSDARFFAAAGVPVCELGPVNDTIHQIGERIKLEDIAALIQIYRRIIEEFGQ